MKDKKITVILVEKKTIAEKIISIFSHLIFKRIGLGFFSESVYIFYSNGHLMGVREKKKTWDINSISRIINNQIDLYLSKEEIIKTITKFKINRYDIVVGTDYDIEGQVIGNDFCKLVVKEHNLPETIFRWKFSSLSKIDLETTYKKLLPIEKSYPLLHKGEYRRNSDFIDGISATKLINLVNKKANIFLTIGRVKSAILRIIDNRRREVDYYLKNKIYQYYASLIINQDGKKVVLRNKIEEKLNLPSFDIFLEV